MPEYVMIPTIDNDGNEISDEEAIAQFLMGGSKPIAEFNSLSEIDQAGFRPFEGEAPWVSRASDALDKATQPLPSAEAVRADPHSSIAGDTIDNPLRGAAEPYIEGLRKLGFYGNIFNPNSKGQTLQIDPDIAQTGLDAADVALTGGAGLGIAAMRNAGRKALTSTVLDSLPDSGVFRKSHVQNLIKAAKKKGAKDVDLNLMEDVLNKIEGDKISMPDFKRTAEERLIPLEMEVTDEWANVGISNIRDIPEKDVPLKFREETAFDTVETHVYNTPFKHIGGGRHLGEKAEIKDVVASTVTKDADKAIGHVHVFHEKEGNRNIRYLAEVQSDAVQRNSYRPGVDDVTRDKLSQEADMLSSKVSKLYELDDLDRRLSDKYQLKINDKKKDPLYQKALEDLNILYRDVMGDDGGFSDLGSPLLMIEERIGYRLDKIQGLLNSGQEAPEGFEQFDPYIFQRMIREENSLAAEKGEDVIRVATPSTQATIEGWNLDPKYNGPKKRQAMLNKFVQKEYGADLVTDKEGFTWYEWEPVESDTIKAFSIGAAPAAIVTEEKMNANKQNTE